MPESEASARGNQVHHVMSEYVRECTRLRIPRDWDLFDQLAKAVGTEAGGILDARRDTFVVDWEHVLSTETVLALDEDFMPAYFWVDQHGEVRTDVRGAKIERIPGVEYSEKPAAYIGTLDVIMLAGVRAKVPDYKSTWKPFDPDTFQSKLYPLLVFQHFSHVDKVTFELDFIRYRKMLRSVSFIREQVPALMKEVERARNRQIQYHEMKEAGETLEALSGDQCVYCPLATNWKCPRVEYNTHTNMPVEEHMRFVMYYDKMRANAMEAIKAYVAANEQVTITDANGNEYTAGYHGRESEVFPAVTTLAACMKWNDDTGGMEKNFLAGLEIKSGTIKGKLYNAKGNPVKKRKELLDRMLETGVIEHRTKASFFGVKSKSSNTMLDGAPPYDPEEY